MKQKKCKGTGRAKGSGCGKVKYIHRFGLCQDCFKSWCLTTSEGKEYLNKMTIKGSAKGKKEAKREQKRKTREEREKNINYKVKLQREIQLIARLIDIGLPCLARGYHAGQLHGGHVFSKGGNSNMSFNLLNIHRQSAQSNKWQNDDGLLREGLVKEYGQGLMDFLTHLRGVPSPKYNNEEYKVFYRKACKISKQLKRDGKRFGIDERIEKRNEINLELGIYDKESCVYQGKI